MESITKTVNMTYQVSFTPEVISGLREQFPLMIHDLYIAAAENAIWATDGQRWDPDLEPLEGLSLCKTGDGTLKWFLESDEDGDEIVYSVAHSDWRVHISGIVVSD